MPNLAAWLTASNFTLKAAVISTMVGVPYAAFLLGMEVPSQLWDFAVGAGIAAGGFAIRDASK